VEPISGVNKGIYTLKKAYNLYLWPIYIIKIIYLIIPSLSRNIWLFVRIQTYQYFNTRISKKVKLEDLLLNEMSLGGAGAILGTIDYSLLSVI